MSGDSDLDYIKRKKLLQMQKASLLKKAKESEASKKKDEPNEIDVVKTSLDKLFVGRAWEIWNIAERQYPEVTKKLGVLFSKMVIAGSLKNPITGEQLYSLLRKIGLRIRLKRKIRILESGEMKTIAEKLREE